MSLYDLVKFLHVLTAVFMAAPLYNLIVVNERVRFGKAHLQVDQYFENLIRSNAIRCYVYQATVLVTGVALVALRGPMTSLYLNPVLLMKLVAFLLLTVFLSLVHFSIQPRIDASLAQAAGDSIPQPVAAVIGPLRLRRKRLAATCLFLVVTAVLLGLQVDARFAPSLTAVLVAAVALFAWRVYRTRIPYGWV